MKIIRPLAGALALLSVAGCAAGDFAFANLDTPAERRAFAGGLALGVVAGAVVADLANEGDEGADHLCALSHCSGPPGPPPVFSPQ